ncbi:unnamed protein product [Lactuca saligna]|uniref:Uncharacterized protein n=1 Tax=Lactuca saligna TaxID=75948 RepID=A0AA35YDZ7_LACSI|nr:unnamed protein product [Lactuca saligna]
MILLKIKNSFTKSPNSCLLTQPPSACSWRQSDRFHSLRRRWQLPPENAGILQSLSIPTSISTTSTADKDLPPPVERTNARKEFEEARFEKDPEVITRLLIGGHDAVQAALDKLVEKQKAQIAKEKADLERR